MCVCVSVCVMLLLFGKVFTSPWLVIYISLPLLQTALCVACIKVADVKRVFSLRETLLLLDFDDESAGPLKAVLLQCIVCGIYLTTAEVRVLFGKDFVETVECLVENSIHASFTLCMNPRGWTGERK